MPLDQDVLRITNLIPENKNFYVSSSHKFLFPSCFLLVISCWNTFPMIYVTIIIRHFLLIESFVFFPHVKKRCKERRKIGWAKKIIQSCLWTKTCLLKNCLLFNFNEAFLMYTKWIKTLVNFEKFDFFQ